MLDQIKAEQLEDAIERFEDTWSEDAIASMHKLLDEYELSGSLDAIAELIRIDIELRYRYSSGVDDGANVDVGVYLDEFPALKHSPVHIGCIANEEFRVRENCGLPNHASRWQHLPGIRNEVWFQRLLVEASTGSFQSRLGWFQPSIDSGIDLAFQNLLAEEGFRLVEEIGQGAIGRVYLATQNDLADRHVVLKVVTQPMSESQKMAMLQHTNIVPIYSSFQILSRSVICMPYAGRLTLADFLKSESDPSRRAGESLISTVRARIDSTKITSLSSPSIPEGVADHPTITMSPAADDRAVLKPLDELQKLDSNHLATWIFKRLASALAHAHARGVLHNDLKPANVLIRNDGEPALLDFNLSLSLGKVNPRQAGGTLPYMSPETYRALMGQNIIPEAPSDIYSMGVMLFQFVTGRLPFQNPASMAPIDLEPAIQIRKGSPSWSENDTVSPGLKSIINRCLAYAPEDRYKSADELYVDLSCEHESLSLVHSPETRLQKISKWVRRHPSFSLAVSVATFLGFFLVPSIFGTLAWVNQTRHTNAVAAFQAFASDSEQTLAAMLANVRRDTEPLIRQGMGTLENHGILDLDKFNGLMTSEMTQDEKQQVYDTALRHVIQVGRLEIQRLNSKGKSPEVNTGDLERIDQLIATAERLQGDSPSRACAFMKASRARLGTDEALYQTLMKKALAIDPATDGEIFLEANRLWTVGENAASIEILSGLTNKNTIPPGLRWISLGAAQVRNDDWKAATKSYTQAIDYYPALSGLYLSRGNCYLKLRQGLVVEADFSKAIEIEPDLIPAWILRASFRLGRQRFDEAISDLTHALVLSPGNVSALLMRSNAYRRAGRLDEAAQDFQDAMLPDNVDVVALQTRSKARRSTDPEGALNDLKRADELDPNNIEILTSMSRILSNDLGQNQEGLELLLRIAETQPDDERALVDCAVLLARLGRHAEAREYIDRALVSTARSSSYYQAACACALNAERQSQVDALSFLAKAIHQGYQADQLQTDPDLESIRTMPGFDAISRFYQLANLRKRKPL